jgi:hypothetical protein
MNEADLKNNDRTWNFLQVEFYLSDQNLPTDNFLMKIVRKDPEGWGKFLFISLNSSPLQDFL